VRDGIVLVAVEPSRAGMDEVAAARRALAARGGIELPPAGARGAVLLATCHRVELYTEGLSPVEAVRAFRHLTGRDVAPGRILLARGDAAGRHLLRVAAGLESAVPGEDQVLCQVRRAYRDACARGASGPLLHRLFHAAFRAGKRVRAETDLARGCRSLAGAGINRAGSLLAPLGRRTALVLGCGETGALAARRLCQRGIGRLLLANRTRERARELALRLAAECRESGRSPGIEAVPWEWRVRALARADLLVAATGAPAEVIGADELREAVAGHGRPLVVLDLAMPPDVAAPPELAGRVARIDVPALLAERARDRDRSARAVAAAEAIVEEELADWRGWVRRRERRRCTR